MGGLPPARAGFLKRPMGRIIASTLLGVLLSIMGGLLIVEFYLATNGADKYFLTDLWSSSSKLVTYPPFVPLLVSSALFTRGVKEGATAGFSTVLLVVLLPFIATNGSIAFECETGLCGLGIILTFLSPLAGALLGAGGGWIGGSRANRRKPPEEA